MVRNAYQTNIVHGFGEFKPIFANVGTPDPDDLRGFRPCPASNVIEWDWFLPMGAPGPFPQKARKIDTKLANALTFLHEGAPEDRVNVLAYRNLKRSWTFELPAGSVVARKFCVDPVALEDGEPDALWYYILKEAETVESGERLGPVGSTIVCATFAGLLAGDPSSWINMDPCWMPDSESLLTDADREPGEAEWKLSSIIRIAGAPVSAADF
jgi:hypothetical protein